MKRRRKPTPREFYTWYIAYSLVGVLIAGLIFWIFTRAG